MMSLNYANSQQNQRGNSCENKDVCMNLKTNSYNRRNSRNEYKI